MADFLELVVRNGLDRPTKLLRDTYTGYSQTIQDGYYTERIEFSANGKYIACAHTKRDQMYIRLWGIAEESPQVALRDFWTNYRFGIYC